MRTDKTWHLWQLLFLLAAIALLPALLASGWAVRSAAEQRRVEAERSALDLSRALAIAVGTELESTISSLRTLTQSPALAQGQVAAFYKIAQSARRANPSWRALILADADGRLLFTTARPYGEMGRRIVDPGSLQVAIRSGKPAVGSALVGPDGNMAFPVRVPVMGEGMLKYVLSAAVAPEPMLEILRQQKIPADWVVAVFDASGRRVARSRDHRSNAPSPSLARMLASGAPEGVGVTTTLEGVKVLTAFTRVYGHSWTVAVGIPAARFGGLVGRGAFLYLAGMLATLVAWALAAAWLSRGIARSVGDLQQRAVRLVREGAVLAPMGSHIREINEADSALVALSRERVEIESERAALLASLNAALDASQLALAQATEAGRAKDHFLAMLGHEMRNPLAPIVSALELLDLRGDERTAAEREILRRQVDHLHRLVDDLLDASRIVQGKLEIRKERFDLRQIGRWAQESVCGAAEASHARLEIDLPDTPLWIDGDPARLLQAVSNLLSNAIRFAPGGSICLHMTRAGDDALIVVEDDGAGMDAETVEHAFQPFFQASQSIARSRGGLGLGLAIVKAIVLLHAGNVGASSRGPGMGSRFQIRLPQASSPDAPVLQQQDTGLRASRRVLVVDDNVDAAQLVAAGLEAAGHRVCIAHTARDALVLMESFRPEAAILDIGMPEMDGYQLARAIRARDTGSSCQLIALSGYGQQRDKDLARAAGFDHHLTKPVRFAELNRFLAVG